MRETQTGSARSAHGLKSKGLLIVALPLAFEIAFALLVMSMERTARLDHEAEVRGRETYASAYRLAQLLVDAETSIRGYVITGDRTFTEPYDRAMAEVPDELRRFHAISIAAPAETKAIERHVQPLLQYHTEQRDRVRAGRRAEAAAIVARGDGKRRMDAFRSQLNAFLARHRVAEEARSRSFAGTRRGLRNVILGGLLINIIVAIAMSMYFTTSVARRIGVIVENTFRLERQEPLHRRLRGTDELTHLDARFHAMAEALDKSRAELESFSYSVSHDLRAPLRAVNGYARMLEEDYAERLDGEGRRYLGTIQSEAARMGTLIDDLLAFSRLGRQPLELLRVDVADVAREALADVEPSASTSVADSERSGRAAAEAGTRPPVRIDSPPPALADRSMLRQVFANLLSNAIKFSAHTPAAAAIEVGGVRAEGENIYWVRDHGAGFDMRYADKLFGVFQRLHAAHEFEGTGVGLAIVHRIVERHGGRVWAESEEGRGACFFFSLPRPRES